MFVVEVARESQPGFRTGSGTVGTDVVRLGCGDAQQTVTVAASAGTFTLAVGGGVTAAIALQCGGGRRPDGLGGGCRQRQRRRVGQCRRPVDGELQERPGRPAAAGDGRRCEQANRRQRPADRDRHGHGRPLHPLLGCRDDGEHCVQRRRCGCSGRFGGPGRRGSRQRGCHRRCRRPLDRGVQGCPGRAARGDDGGDRRGPGGHGPCSGRGRRSGRRRGGLGGHCCAGPRRWRRGQEVRGRPGEWGQHRHHLDWNHGGQRRRRLHPLGRSDQLRRSTWTS